MNKFLLFIIAFKLTATFCEEVDNPEFKENENTQLGVRAVIVKCEIPEEDFPSDSDRTRFQREELFKHNALRDCTQKLAVTIKISSDPNQAFGEEYIPIDHVVGVNKKRIRLLNPYVLRLRRKPPCQAYKLRRIDGRMPHNLQSDDWSATSGSGPLVKLDDNNRNRYSYSIKIRDQKQPLRENILKTKMAPYFNNFNPTLIFPKTNASLGRNLREKWHTEEYEYAWKWTSTDFTPQVFKELELQLPHRILYGHKEAPLDTFDKSEDSQNVILHDRAYEEAKLVNSNSDNINKRVYSMGGTYEISNMISSKHDKSNEINSELFHKEIEEDMRESSNFKNEERNFALYEIGDPDLWFSTQVQIYEKLNTPEGKTVWNDLTKESIASVSTINPKWSNQDVDIQYKPVEFLDKGDFMLPLKGLCLLVLLKYDHENTSKDKSGEFVIVPVDDVISLGDAKQNKRCENSSEYDINNSEVIDQNHRPVIVRTARALLGGTGDKLQMVSHGSNQYLKLAHTKPHYAQIDLEARADDNELILVGVLGRLTTIVSDTTRRIRSVLTVQATNPGLAAARFRVLARECSSESIDSSIEMDETIAGPILLPPKHTQNFRLTLPLRIPIESVNCTIALVNEDDESVAVRDIRIKRGDRCFCVWYCDCVCLGEDPRLLCHDMTAAQLSAAGLSTRQKSRHARSICYPDIVTVNLFITFIGVLLALLLLGSVKAFVGLILRCVASWGLQLLLQMPRKLDHYYESSLRNRRVVYDNEGWPVHPDTKERTVRLVSKPMEFMLNLIFFIILPCLMIWDAMKRLAAGCQAVGEKTDTNYKNPETKKCFSSQDVQGIKMRHSRHREGLHRWMSPHAEELTSGLWQKGLRPLGKKTRDYLRPLLREETCRRKTCEQSLCVDSEQEDTEYVLMQMQKSRESLANSHR